MNLIDDFEDVSELNALAWQAHNPLEAFESGGLYSLPVFAGSLKLYRPTVGAKSWFIDIAQPAISEDLHELCFIYMCSLDRESQRKLLELDTAEQIESLVRSFVKCVDVTEQELLSALEFILGEGPAGAEASDKNPYPDLVLHLSREFNTPPEYWIWEADEGIIETAISSIMQRVIEEDKANRKGTKNKTPPNPNLPHQVALTRFRKKFDELLNG